MDIAQVIAQNLESSNSTPIDQVMKKKARTKGPQANESHEDTKTCHIMSMPFEILAEILLYTTSPRDVLAVARCSKFFCATLLYPTAAYIWKNARKVCRPPLPEPLPIHTESSFAALVFDGGECEACHKVTTATYTSFAIRLRLCGKPICRDQIKSVLTTVPYMAPHEVIKSCIPVAESSACLTPSTQPIRFWPNLSQFTCRTSELTTAIDEYRQIPPGTETLPASLEVKKKRKVALMEFALSLYRWKEEQQALFKAQKKTNEAFAKGIARAEGWQEWDLINSPAYGALHRNRTKILETVVQKDYDLIKTKVEAEILKVVETRERRSKEEAYRVRRADVAQHYNRLRSSKTEEALPTLDVFRKIPIINSLQRKETSQSGVSKELKASPLVDELLRDELRKWREAAKASLATTLGYPDWKTASTKKLHPVDRLTARFQCQKCHKVATRYKEAECLDFAGACVHQCPHLKKKERGKDVWTAEQFVRDDKAIAAVSQVLALCGAKVDDVESFSVVAALGSRIMCTSCEARIVMAFPSVIGHSQRHDSMQLSLLSESEASSILKRPIEYGLCKRLMGPEYKAKALQGLRNYGCRHCDQVRSQPTAELPDVAKSEKVESKPNLLHFDGLRSHLKAKHGAELIRDEDFYCHPKLNWNAPISAIEKSRRPQKEPKTQEPSSEKSTVE